MDLSINNISKANLQKVGFKGLKGDYSKENSPVYKFVAPPHSKNEDVYLEIVPVYLDGNEYKAECDFELEKFHNDLVEIYQEDSNINAFAYRYKIVDSNNNQRYVTDGARTSVIEVDGRRMNLNVVECSNGFGITPKGGSMRHSFVDSDAILDSKGKLKVQDKEFVRNHFNKLGGSIKGLTYLLTQTNELDPYRYIISTPDIGADPMSSHKYWPANQYQCTNVQDFKDFNFELFKRGKGYVADGAFTSQGIQSPMLQHALKWGEESPFYDILKINGNVALGILPNASIDDEINIYNYIGVKLVNGKGEGYNPEKPTYIQFYDTRLASDEAIKSNELIKAYDKIPQDNYDFSTHQDSILPYSFEIDPTDVSKTSAFKNSRYVLVKDIKNLNDFLTFDHYKIADKEHASGATYWVGNVDIIKMNLSNPSVDQNREGLVNARNYLYGVAGFWTEMVQSDLILRTAQMSDTEKQLVALRNGILNERFEELRNSLNKDMNYMVLKQNKTVKDYISEFPLQSIEVSPELTAIFAQPQFLEEFLDEKTFNKLNELTEGVVSSIIPEQYSENEEYKTYVVKTYANQILKNIFIKALNPNAISDDGEIKFEELKNVTLKSLQTINPSSVEAERRNIINVLKKRVANIQKEDINVSGSQKLNQITLNDFKLAELIVEQGKGGLNWRFDAAKDIADLDAVSNNDVSSEFVWEGDKNYPGIKTFWKEFIDEIKKYNPASYVVCELTNVSGKEVDFIEGIGATTTSNYSEYFNNLSKFVGVNPEEGYNPGDNIGNINFLKSQTAQMFKYTPDNVLLSHVFVDNHDKPRLLHTLPLDMELFLKGRLTPQELKTPQIKELIGTTKVADKVSSRAVAVGLMYKKAIDETYRNDFNTKKALNESLRNLVLGKSSLNDEMNFKKALAFANRPYEVTVRDIFKGAGLNDRDDEIQQLHWNIMKNPALQMERLWQVMNAVLGVPTLFNGTEFLQTGYEEFTKNVDLGNRNQILHELKDSEIGGYKDYFNKMRAISGISLMPQLTALKNGFPVLLEVQHYNFNGESTISQGAFDYFVKQLKEFFNKGNNIDKEFKYLNDIKNNPQEFSRHLKNDLGIDESYDNHNNFKKVISALEKVSKGKIEANNAISNKSGIAGKTKPVEIFPIYKYDERGSKVLSLISNLGVDNVLSCKQNLEPDIHFDIQSLDLRDEKGRCPFEDGTILKKISYNKKTGQYEIDNTEYKVSGGCLKNITLDDTVTTFCVPNQALEYPKYIASLYNGLK